MTGPKRCNALFCDALLEFDMRVENGEIGENDVQLIDGAFSRDVDAMGTNRVSHWW